jgi:hypothetical protein
MHRKKKFFSAAIDRIRRTFYGELPGLSSAGINFPSAAASIYPLLKKVHLVTVTQCDAQIAEELGRYTYRRAPFVTSLINLRLSKDEIWNRMDRLCRRQIRKAQELGMNVVANQEQEAAYRLISGHIERARFRMPISAAEWESYAPEKNCDVFLCKYGDEPLAARVVMFQLEAARAREFLSATADRQDPRFRNLVGPANRLLLWTALVHYQERGLRHYDLGGLDLDKKSPFYPIAEFKLSFGGDLTHEYNLRLSRNWLLRVTLRSVLAVRRVLKRMVLFPLGLKNFHEIPVALRRIWKRAESPAQREKDG